MVQALIPKQGPRREPMLHLLKSFLSHNLFFGFHQSAPWGALKNNLNDGHPTSRA